MITQSGRNVKITSHTNNPVFSKPTEPSTAGVGTLEYSGYSGYTILAFNDNVTTTERILSDDVPAGLDITFPASTAVVSITSSNANDVLAGTGSNAVLVIGLDDSNNIIQEVVLMNGQTPVLTTNLFRRINGFLVLSAGSSGYNEGTIYISVSGETYSSGVPTTICYFTIGATYSVGQTGIYSVPNGIRAIGRRFYISDDATENKPLNIRVKQQSTGGAVLTTALIKTVSSSASVDLQDAGSGISVGTDTWITAFEDTGVGQCEIYYTLVLKEV